MFAHDSHTLSIISTVLQGAVHGRLSGSYQGRPNQAVFNALVPGDIIFCHNSEGGYGYYTHCALYVGSGRVVESYSIRNGTHVVPIDNFHDYDEICVMRVKCPDSLRQGAADFALTQVEQGYNLFSGLHDGKSTYCSKLVWSAYAEQGIQLCAQSRWIIPDDLAASSKLQVVNTTTPGDG